MRSLRYLNGVLTIIAVLLTLNLWGQWHSSAQPEVLPATPRAHAQGLANDKKQRMEMIGLLKDINVKLDAIKGRLDKPFEVKVPGEGEGKSDQE